MALFRLAVTLLLLLPQSDVSHGFVVTPRSVLQQHQRITKATTKEKNANKNADHVAPPKQRPAPLYGHNTNYRYDTREEEPPTERYGYASNTDHQQYQYQQYRDQYRDHHQHHHVEQQQDQQQQQEQQVVEVVSLYDVLGISRSASPKDIKQAFRHKAKLYHPDVNPQPDSTELFQEINEAYQILNDPSLKMQYDLFTPYVEEQQVDQQHQQHDEAAANTDPASSSSYYSAALPSKPKGPVPLPGGSTIVGDDLQFYLRLSYQFATRGGRVRIIIRRLETCESCRGIGLAPGHRHYDRYDRPCGYCHGIGRVRHYHRHPLSGHIIDDVETCPVCRGRQHHLDDNSFCHDCDGTGVHWHQRAIYVDVPGSLRPGQVLRLRQCGHTGPHDGPRGDLYIFVDIQPPTMFQSQMLAP
jgi:DnaJ-class molecular chaperone